jgi:N utilization substance protein A
MSVNHELLMIFSQLEREKGIDQAALVEAIENALVTAAQKVYGKGTDMHARMDRETGKIEIYQRKEVVLKVEDESLEVSLLEARQLDPEVMPGDEVEVEIDANEFGRIAAQTAKQVIVQKLREAEREMVFNTYSSRVGEIINGIVHGFSRGSIIVDLGKTEAELPTKEQVPRERYKQGDRIKAYILEVKQNAKGPQVILSRTSINFLTALFELEVPEIAEKIVEIRSAAREPGGRSKIAVVSHDPNVDPVGACVGVKGSRVQAVVNELRGERIDIIPWLSDPALFVSNALSPAQVTRVIINEAEQSMEVIVADEELSLAIGKNGQNVRLAAKLTNWNITIKSETQVEDENKPDSDVTDEDGGLPDDIMTVLPPKTAETLAEGGINDLETINAASDEDMLALQGVGPKAVERVREVAAQFTAALEDAAARDAEEAEGEEPAEGTEEAESPELAEGIEEAVETETGTESDTETESESDTESETDDATEEAPEEEGAKSSEPAIETETETETGTEDAGSEESESGPEAQDEEDEEK